MVANAAEVDPYILVARHLQEGEASRAELRAMTDLEYSSIEAALERFEMMDRISKQIDGKGIEHFTWKGDPYTPEPTPTPRPRIVETVSKDLPVEPETEKRRPATWSLAKAIKRCIDILPNDQTFTMPSIYEQLMKRHPVETETYSSFSLKSQITQNLNSLVGKFIKKNQNGHGGVATVYQKIGGKAQMGQQPNTEQLAATKNAVTTEQCGCGRPTNHGGRCAWRRENQPSLHDEILQKKKVTQAEVPSAVIKQIAWDDDFFPNAYDTLIGILDDNMDGDEKQSVWTLILYLKRIQAEQTVT